MGKSLPAWEPENMNSKKKPLELEGTGCFFLLLFFLYRAFLRRKNNNSELNFFSNFFLGWTLLLLCFSSGARIGLPGFAKQKTKQKWSRAQRYRAFSPFSGSRTRPMRHVQLLRMLHSTGCVSVDLDLLHCSTLGANGCGAIVDRWTLAYSCKLVPKPKRRSFFASAISLSGHVLVHCG